MATPLSAKVEKPTSDYIKDVRSRNKLPTTDNDVENIQKLLGKGAPTLMHLNLVIILYPTLLQEYSSKFKTDYLSNIDLQPMTQDEIKNIRKQLC